MRLKGLIEEGTTPVTEEEQQEELFPVFDKVLDLLESLEPSKYTDKMCDSMGEALDSFIEMVLCIEEIELDEESTVLFEDVMEELSTYADPDELNEYQYKPKRTKHGTRRSKASMMTGKQKQAYIKQLKKRRRAYKSNAGMRAKRKKQQYWHRKTAQYKRTQKVYKHATTTRKKASPKVKQRRIRA